MKCPKCGSINAKKDGKRPQVMRGNKIVRKQAFKCNNCKHQWRVR